MQEQQYNTKAILLKERVTDDGVKTVVVERYKVVSDIPLMDGFVLPAGSDVRRVVGSVEQRGCLNVVFENDFDVKRIMWVKKESIELTSAKDELWCIEDYMNEIKDNNESWFD